MSLASKITELLNTQPNLTGNQIAEKLQSKGPTTKVVLCQMAKENKVVREKQTRADGVKLGPQNIYTYRVNA